MTPRWLAHPGTDLSAPSIAAEVQVRAAWVALRPDGEPVRHGLGRGFLTCTIRLFSGREGAAEFGRPALVDLFGGEPVRVHAPGMRSTGYPRNAMPSFSGAT